MTLQEAMRTRHSVRQYLDKSVEEIIINQVRDLN